MNKGNSLSRRSFLAKSATALAAVPHIMPETSLGRGSKAALAAEGSEVNVPIKNYELKIKIIKNYLNLPVDDSNPKTNLTIQYPDGKPYSIFNIPLATKKQVFWASQDVRQFKGQMITIIFDQIIKDHKALGMIYQSNEIPQLDTIYKLKYRPRFHYSPKVGWVNDPNGLLYYNGVYHFFYQHNPYSMRWDNMRWGYATSTDLVHWTEHGVGFEMPAGKLAYSGGGVVDWNNTTGLQKGQHPPLLLYITEPTEGQYLAYSDDGGSSWKLYGDRPVTTIGHRDPKVFWYKPGNHWVMTLFGEKPHHFHFSTSKNGIDWTPYTISSFPGHRECPDMFEMAVENDPTDKKWIFLSGSGDFRTGDCAKYNVGTFDGVKFTSVQDSMVIDSGRDNYSTQVISDAPNGRKIFMSWITRDFSTLGLEGMPSNAQFRVPWELSLYKDSNGIYRLGRLPVEELKSIRSKKHAWKNYSLKSNQILLTGIKKYELDIETEISPDVSGSFSFMLAGCKATYHCKDNQLQAFKKATELTPVNGILKFRILLDRTSVSIFANDGTVVMSGFSPVNFDQNPFDIISESGDHVIKKLDVYEMKSIWE